MSKTGEIVNAIESVLPKRRPIEHHENFINKKKAATEISQCIASGIQNYKYIEQFEGWLRDFTGSKHAIATNTGTGALHVALIAAGIKPKDEIIVPVSTFVATANAVVYCGATPHFIDAGPNLDPIYLNEYLTNLWKQGKGANVKAIIVVHLLGIPADIEGICKVASDFNLTVIEDASQALGTRINGRHVGTFSLLSTLSFNLNKIVTTAGGGAVITDSDNIADVVRKLASTARRPHKWLVEHESMAWNYRIGSINAALGLAQASEINKILAIKQGLSLRYRKALKGLVEFVEPTTECETNHWLNVILVDNRDELLEELHNRGIKARASFSPLHTLPFYKDSIGSHEIMEKALRFFSRAVCLPSGSNL